MTPTLTELQVVDCTFAPGVDRPQRDVAKAALRPLCRCFYPSPWSLWLLLPLPMVPLGASTPPHGPFGCLYPSPWSLWVLLRLPMVPLGAYTPPHGPFGCFFPLSLGAHTPPLSSCCRPSLDYLQIWRRPLSQLPVHKDVPRLLKGMEVVGPQGQILYRDDGTARPSDPAAQIAAVSRLMLGLSRQLDSAAMSAALEAQLAACLPSGCGDVAGGLRRLLGERPGEGMVPEACMTVQVVVPLPVSPLSSHLSSHLSSLLSSHLSSPLPSPPISSPLLSHLLYSPLLQVLKAIHQEMIFPAVFALRTSIYTVLPYDGMCKRAPSLGGWSTSCHHELLRWRPPKSTP